MEDKELLRGKLREKLIAMKETHKIALVDIDEMLKCFDSDNDEWYKDRVDLWSAIYKEGGIVTKERLYEIWTDMGKDTRGLGGFFCGKYPSLATGVDNKIMLTENADKNCKEWTGKTLAELNPK